MLCWAIHPPARFAGTQAWRHPPRGDNLAYLKQTEIGISQVFAYGYANVPTHRWFFFVTPSPNPSVVFAKSDEALCSPAMATISRNRTRSVTPSTLRRRLRASARRQTAVVGLDALDVSLRQNFIFASTTYLPTLRIRQHYLLAVAAWRQLSCNN